MLIIAFGLFNSMESRRQDNKSKQRELEEPLEEGAEGYGPEDKDLPPEDETTGGAKSAAVAPGGARADQKSADD
ncbi:hypothetical protein TELCIR_22955, partial [Teladorsagia circumcincta]